MKRLLFVAAVLAVATASGSCTKYVPYPSEVIYDTVTTVRVDTVSVTHIDTLIQKVPVTEYDTVTKVITVAGPPVHDTTIVVRVDTVTKTRTDTLYLPSVEVHDTTWVYGQTNPTNPLGGGDVTAGIAYFQFYGDAPNYIVFWHGHFVGTVTGIQHRTYLNDPAPPGIPVTNGIWYTWRAWLYIRGQADMPLARPSADFATLTEATNALVPIAVTVSP